MPSNSDSTPAASRLMDLPLELFVQIIVALEAPGPLFVPIYGREEDWSYDNCHLDTQHVKYYGHRTEEQELASQTILNWSSTCSHYRRLLAPHLFRDIVLRTRPKSMESVAALAKTSHWSQVKSLTVCITFLLRKEREEGITIPFADLDPQLLERVLSDLPPNLDSLTVDLPWDWFDDLGNWESEPSEIASDGEFANVFYSIFHALGQNDISKQRSFALNVLNIPGARFCAADGRDATEEDGFRNFLSHATIFKMTIPKAGNHVGWQRIVFWSESDNFSSALGTKFVDNLTNAANLTIETNPSCHIGSHRHLHPLAFPMPAEETRFLKLKKLTLDHFWLDAPLIHFITWHAPNLEHLTLLNCTTDEAGGSLGVETEYSWAYFFTTLATSAKSLKTLVLKHLKYDEGLLEFYWAEIVPPQGEIKEALAQLQALKARRDEMGEDRWRRRKRVLPHMFLNDEEYGFVEMDEERNAQRFLEGADHKALLELWKVLEERGGDGVVYL